MLILGGGVVRNFFNFCFMSDGGRVPPLRIRHKSEFESAVTFNKSGSGH